MLSHRKHPIAENLKVWQYSSHTAIDCGRRFCGGLRSARSTSRSWNLRSTSSRGHTARRRMQTSGATHHSASSRVSQFIEYPVLGCLCRLSDPSSVSLTLLLSVSHVVALSMGCRQRVTEHNILVVAKYYSNIKSERLALLLDLPAAAAEKALSTMVVDGTVCAKIDRPAGIFSPIIHTPGPPAHTTSLAPSLNTTFHVFGLPHGLRIS